MVRGSFGMEPNVVRPEGRMAGIGGGLSKRQGPEQARHWTAEFEFEADRAVLQFDTKTSPHDVEQLNTAVRWMDEMTQQNAALVEEINAAIEQTESQASELDRIVDVFTIEPALRAHLTVD